jgi:hypothetical protein
MPSLINWLKFLLFFTMNFSKLMTLLLRRLNFEENEQKRLWLENKVNIFGIINKRTAAKLLIATLSFYLLFILLDEYITVERSKKIYEENKQE